MKIFRKLRFKTITEKKVQDYLLYALGEIVLVVIGILIALQINNWNQTAIDNEALKEYLVKIKAHTLEDSRQLDQLIYGRTQIADVCKKARISMLDKTEDENLYLFMVSGLAFAEYYFKPNKGGYEALKNSGYFGKINNTPLDSLLSKYHGHLDIIAENEKSYNDYMVGQEEYLSTQFDRTLLLAKAFIPQDSLALRATTPMEYDAAFREYTGYKAYRNVVGLAAFQFDEMIRQYRELKDIGEKVVEEINALGKG